MKGGGVKEIVYLKWNFVLWLHVIREKNVGKV